MNWKKIESICPSNWPKLKCDVCGKMVLQGVISFHMKTLHPQEYKEGIEKIKTLAKEKIDARKTRNP